MATQGNARNAILASLSLATTSKIQASLQPIAWTAGVVLNEPGDEVEQAVFPDTGMVSLLAVMRDGSAVETATVGREGVVGAMAGLGLHVSLARAVVQTPLIGWRIGAPQFRKLVHENDELRDVVVRYNEALLAQVQMTAACNAVHSLEARLSRWILQTRDRTDDDGLPLTQELLSQMLGVRRSSVSEVAAKLQAANLISYKRGMIFIEDRPGLERSACECYENIKVSAETILKR